MTPQDQILDLLRTYQKRNNLRDDKMAELLGIAATSWNLFRRGKRNLPKPGILGGFVRLNPRRTRLLGAFLTGDEAGDIEDPALVEQAGDAA